ncbi:TOM1-like protein 2 isoform X2 [Lampetra fluviatilis]
MSLLDLVSNPFGTAVGHRIERATDGALPGEDWTLNMEICDIVSETEDGPKDAIRAIRKKLSGNKNFREVMLTLTVLETCVKNCGHRFHALVAQRDFVDGVLVKVVQPKNNPPALVQDKVLSLIQAWADAFRSSPDLTGVVHVYEELKKKGIEFPSSTTETLSPIHTPQRSVRIKAPTELNNAQAGAPRPVVHAPLPAQTRPQPTGAPSPLYANANHNFQANPATMEPLAVGIPTVPQPQPDGSITPTPEQISKLRAELEVVQGNIKVMSEMLNEVVPGQENSSDLELLQELNGTCRTMQRRVMELISRVASEPITEELLLVNDDLNNVFLRYDRFERYRAGRAPQNVARDSGEAALYSTVLRNAASPLPDAADDNLIDLGPGSPSVMTGSRGSGNLSSQLAGMGLAGESVSGTLTSLGGERIVASGRAQALQTAPDSFPRRELVHGEHEEDPAIAAMLPETHDQIDTWLARQGMIPISQPGVMDDIEQWLNTDVSEEKEGVTSEEFDKFLEERARVADQLPDLPSPPSAAPSRPEPPAAAAAAARAPTQNRARKQSSDDGLMAI